VNRFRIFLLLALIFAAVLLSQWYKTPQEPLFKWQTYSNLYYDKEQKLLRFTLADDERYRLYIPFEKIPKELIQATVLYEDQYFYTHPGVNIPAIWRAFVSTYFTKQRRVGASTITMQVARIAFNLRSKTIMGKIRQIFYALWLETHYSKEQILEYYFNIVSYGGNIEGIEAASQIYFHKPAEQMSFAQIMSMVTIPQNPIKRNPKTPSGYKEMIEARKRLYVKYRAQYLQEATLQEKERIELWMQLPLRVYTDQDLPFAAGHFIDYLIKTYPFESGHIQTTLDLASQKMLEEKISSWVGYNADSGIANAAALLINVKTMGVEAWVGSADFFDKDILGQVDAVTSKRSPGSILKPFVYALALDQGLIHPQSILKDSPYRFGAYTPENFDKAFLGPVTATNALISSRNVPAVRLSSRLEEPTLYTFLKNTGVSKMKEPEHYGMSIALGGLETSMLEVGRLYALLANEGRLREPRLLHNDIKGEPKQFLSAESAWLTLNMLKKNPPPYEKKFVGVDSEKRKYAWKTGTSYAFRDAWTAGVSQEYALIVWVGNFDGKGNNNFIGRKAAAPLFFNIMHALDAHEVLEDDLRAQESALNISLVDICTSTGTLPGKLCPQVQKSWFIPGVSPIQTSSVYREVPINIATGKRACVHQEGITRLEVFEFWPSDIVEIFKMAGIQKRALPPMQDACEEFTGLNQREAPEIQSPANNLVYTLENDKIKSALIPFQAVLDADSSKAFWFVNKAYVGTSKPSEPFFWKPRMGEFTVRVVDEKGLSASRRISVQLAH
jgi:penicillin-binding protein 1C